MKWNAEVDVVILSYAQNEDLKKVTDNCLSSLKASEDPENIKFNIVVVESQKDMYPYMYPGTVTIYPEEEFGYHRYMNIGIGMTSSPFICLCNNDLLFHPHWATEILTTFSNYKDLSSASPICSIHHPAYGFQLNTGIYPGFGVRREVAGWCLFLKRDVLHVTGKLDENYKFWCADNDYANTLWVLHFKHALITSSVVDHLENKTLNSQTKERQDQLTYQEVFYYEKKWNHRLGEGWKLID